MDEQSKPQADAGQIETWGIVEIFGHKKVAGYVRSVPLGGAAMIRVDVPELPAEVEKYTEYDYGQRNPEGGYKQVEKSRTISAVPAFTQFFGIASIFSMTPCTEEAALYAIKRWRVPAPSILPAPLALPSPTETLDELDDDE